MPKLTIIDGNSLLFRAYFATAYPGVEIMRNQKGEPTNAIFAFSNMINKIVSSLKEGESLFVAFDAGKKNFRHDKLETYKANRKPAPEDLVKQFPMAREFLKAFGIFQFEEVGYEGDDIAGTLAKKAASQGYNVTIYTSDRDFLQLVDENITVNLIKKGLSDIAEMTPQLVEETYHIKPIQIIDYKGLRGDSSDNLPGIPGIGDVTAVKLINKYGSFDEIIAHVDEIPGKVGEEIKNNIELGTISRDLAIIDINTPINFQLSEVEYKGYSFKEISEFCQRYGLKQFMNKIPEKWKKSDSNQCNLEVEVVSNLNNIDLGNEIGIEVDLYDRNDYFRSEVFGIALSNKNKIVYLNIADAKKDQKLLSILADEKVAKYAYDFKAIKAALHKENIEVNGLKFDILIASYLLDSTIKNNPQAVMNLYGIDLKSSDEEISLLSTNNPEIAGKIAYFSLFTSDKILAELEKVNALKLFNELEIPLTSTLADMEIEGFPLSKDDLTNFGQEYKEKLKNLTDEICALAGTKFNISSPKQVGDILFNKLGLPDYEKGSTSVDVLNSLLGQHPIIEKLLDYRKYFKLVTTYIDGFIQHIYPDGKIHTSFNQAVTQTGRLSSSNPNLQNISIRDEESKNIRKSFYYDDENIEILSFDYSQIELRILAHLSNCQKLIDVFKSNEDIHASTAKNVFKVDKPSDLQRRKAKVVNFGIVYGISDWGLAEELGIPVKEAKEMIENFYQAYPEVALFFKQIVDNGIKDGFVSTMLGRRRYLTGFHDSNYQVREFAKRAAMNAPIQGSAADLIKLAMIRIAKAIKENNYKSKMVLQIHDELIFKVYKDEKEQIKNLVMNEMKHAMELNVPLEVDGGFGRTWYDAK
ncbi:MAG: DNA polymerase I [Bacilli bacterium]|nr:DNA polymerase I [Bacilli bacterium]